MSSTRLLVLGVVKIFQPVHGYDVRRELLTWRADDWGHVNPGSIYHALKSLTRDGLLEVVGTDAQGARPARTRYALTENGDMMFHGLLTDSLGRVTASLAPLHSALGFFRFLSRAELVALLHSRLAQLQALRVGLSTVIEGGFKPAHVAESFRLSVALNDAEQAWVSEFVQRLEAGEYDTTEPMR